MDIAKIKKELEKSLKEIELKLGKPGEVFDAKKMGELGREQMRLKGIVQKIDSLERVEADIKETEELIQSEEDKEMVKIAEEEFKNLKKEKEELNKIIKSELIPPDLNDEKNAIIEIRAGTGGDEAELFAADLFRMYSRFAENNGLKTEIQSSNRTPIGGIKEIIFEVKGRGAYGYLKFEGGVHRVQRIPETEKSGRIHTSAATVAVFPEAEESDIEIKSEDLRIDTFRASGHGGQSVNTTDSAVRITHLPTGTVVACQDERSQIKNKDKAMKILRSRILAKQQEDEKKSKGETRRLMVGSGDRSEKIRTYNFPQDRVTDHRIHLTLHNLPRIMDGEMDQLIEALKEEENKYKENNEL